MRHYMKLKPSPFVAIARGTKNIEMRLYDEKRQKIQVGDEIEFLNLETEEKILTRVLNLHHYPSFQELYNKFDKIRLGYSEGECAKATDMEQFYSKEEIEKYGVVGIELALLKEDEK